MTAARTMQEFKYFRDGATLVISLDGLNFLSKRGFGERGNTKRDEELQLLMSPGQVIQADEEPQPVTCFCILDQRGSPAPQPWRSSESRTSLATWPPGFSSLPRRCLPTEPRLHSTLTSLASFVSEKPKEACWTRLVLNMQDIFSFIRKDSTNVPPQDAVTKNQHNRFIVLCRKVEPQQLFGDSFSTKECRVSIGDTGWYISDKALSDLENSIALWPQSPNTKTPERVQHELDSTDIRDTGNLKSLQLYDPPGALSWREKVVKRKKSVSFNNDVIVYLFDQESPTVELHSGPHSLPGSYSSSFPDVTSEDGGLEWEDDFSSLEKNCHFQCVRRSAAEDSGGLSLPTRSCSALSRRLFLSRTCLFLTHVSEADLQL